MYVTGLVSVALVLTRVLGISRVGGRYPHGVPLVSGRSSRTAERYRRSPKEQDPHYRVFYGYQQPVGGVFGDILYTDLTLFFESKSVVKAGFAFRESRPP